jgi:hypothetical protein
MEEVIESSERIDRRLEAMQQHPFLQHIRRVLGHDDMTHDRYTRDSGTVKQRAVSSGRCVYCGGYFDPTVPTCFCHFIGNLYCSGELATAKQSPRHLLLRAT